MDFNATGDSGGTMDASDLDALWRENVASALELLRHSGTENLSVVGMRFGATIAGVAAIENELQLSSLVLWDPCESGRSFLRETAALEALQEHDARVNDGEPFETSEFALSVEREEELKRLSLSKCGPGKFADRVLVITRTDRELSDNLKVRLDAANAHWEQTDEQGAMLGVSPLRSVTPTRSLQLIEEWLADVPIQWTNMEALPTRHSQEFREAGGTYVVTERPIEIGEHHLYGLISVPNGPSRGPLIVMLNVANEDHTGPSRQWVELSRRWASVGLRCVRFDLRGVGESSWLPRGKSFVYENEWLADALSVAPFLSEDDPSNVVYIGLSSGVYLAAECAIEFGARGLCAINPPIGMDAVQLIVRLRLSQGRLARALGNRLLWAMLYRPWVFAGIWQVGRLALPRRVARDLLATAAESGAEVLVLASREDVSPARRVPILRSIDHRRIQNPRNYRVEFVAGLDHSMHAIEGRKRTIARLDEFVMDRLNEAISNADQ